MYPLFETVRVQDGEIKHPVWHELRFANSYKKLFATTPHFTLLTDIEIPVPLRTGLVKLRIAYGKTGKEVRFEPYQVKRIKTLKLTEIGDVDYSVKYSDRNQLNLAFADRGEADDVLMIKNGMVTDSSYCNVVFFDGENWITPETPLLEGTARARLITEGKIHPSPIHQIEIQNFQSFKLINAMRDFDSISAEPIEGIRF